MPGAMKLTVVCVRVESANVAVPAPEYSFQRFVGGGPIHVTLPCSVTGCPDDTVRSGPAFAPGGFGERGPSFWPVVWMTSKFVMPTLVKLSKQPAGQRLSGVTEMEKKFPLSATNAPYLLSAVRTAFSCFVQLSEMAKPDLRRSRWPIAGTFGSVE